MLRVPLLVAALIASSLGSASAGQAAGVTVTDGFAAIVGEAGSLRGAESHLFATTLGNAMTLEGTASGVTVTIDDGSFGWSVLLAAPAGSALSAGTYEHADGGYPETPGRPTFDLVGDSTACNREDSRFTVRDIGFDGDGDVSRIDVVFEHHCEFNFAATFGQISVNEPRPDDSLLVAPSAVAWPETDPGGIRDTVPIGLVNTGAVPLHVDAAALEGPDAEAYSIASDGCTGTDLGVGQECQVLVEFKPVGAGPTTAALKIQGGAGAQSVALEGTGSAGHTSWDMTSDWGDLAGGGQGGTFSYTPANARLSAQGDASSIELRVRGADQPWTLALTAAPGDVFTAGQTYPIVGYTDNDGTQPIFNIAGCTVAHGSFTIDQLQVDSVIQRLVSVAVHFTYHCGGGYYPDSGLYGTVAFHAPDAAAPLPATDCSYCVPDTTPPDPVSNAEMNSHLGSVSLSWQNPDAFDFDHAEVLYAAGETPPDPPSSTGLVGDPANTWTAVGLAPGQDYSFTIYACDKNGNVGPGTSFTAYGTDLALSVDHPVVTAGRVATWTVTLRSGSSRALQPLEPVVFYARPHGKGPFTEVKRTNLSSAAVARWSHRMTGPLDVLVQFEGDAGLIGSQSDTVPVAVRYAVSAAPRSTRVVARATDVVSGAVSPAAAGATVQLQRYYRGAWHTTRSSVLTSTSRYSMRFTPATGRFYYRIRKPAGRGLLASTSQRFIVTAVRSTR
jgi:hypothetical protein